MLPGILNEVNAPMEGNNNEYADMPELCDAADDSESDEGSTCDVEDSAFLVEGVDETNDDSKDKEEDVNFLGDGWLWNQWEEIGDDDAIPGPSEYDRYNSPHGLKEGVADSFTTVLECIFKTTCMDRDFFKRLAAQSNKYVREDMVKRSSRLYLGHKFKNITVGEMVRFFGVMLRISLEPRKMGGYPSYFQDSPVVSLRGLTMYNFAGINHGEERSCH